MVLRVHAPWRFAAWQASPVRSPPEASAETGWTNLSHEWSLDNITDQIAKTVAKAVANRTAADLQGVKMNGKDDLRTLVESLTFCAFATLAATMLFNCLRVIWPEIYVPKRPDDTVCEGLSAAANLAHDDDVLDAAGLDGLMLLEFHRLCAELVCFAGLPLVATLCPLHYLLGSSETGDDALGRSGIGTLLVHSMGVDVGTVVEPWFFWCHAAAVWYVVLVSTWLVVQRQLRFAHLRFHWLLRLQKPRATTLLIENIPPELRSDEALRAYFVRMFTEEAVERAYVVRRTQHLRNLIARREQLLNEWKHLRSLPLAFSAARRLWGGGCSPGHATARKEALLQQVRQAQANVRAERERLAVLATGPAGGPVDPQLCAAAGFVTLSSRRWSRLASREQFRVDANELVASIAPDPADVIYEDLARNSTHRFGGLLLAAACFAGLLLLWMPVVLTITGLTSLTSLKGVVPGLSSWCETHRAIASLVEGVLATAALRAFIGMLPSLLLHIVLTLMTPRTHTGAQLALQDWYYAFQVTFIVLVTAVGRSLYYSAQEALERPARLLFFLADNLPSATHFYLEYVVLGWPALGVELLRLGSLRVHVLGGVAAMVGGASRTRAGPCESGNDDYDDASCGVGVRMARAALMITMAIVFCSCSPFITVVALLYFVLGERVYRYLLLFAEQKFPDSGGSFWLLGLRHVSFGLVLYVVLMVSILTRHASGKGPAVSAASALFVVFWGHERSKALSLKLLPFENVADVDASASLVVGGSRGDGSCRRNGFVQWECLSQTLSSSDAESDVEAEASNTSSSFGGAVRGASGVFGERTQAADFVVSDGELTAPVAVRA
eukprot:TRINITY_DN67799_c0_g1_i1.p1 TRINITY_DN67799_c0_g1~~TRINITY_DN67799_c0_g1_i1.p1  ORF type:complete len:852 (+),score=151.94 TRINITY_DN67799_c0_g1_i1:38-2557(+)